jgi:hypothetical protein
MKQHLLWILPVGAGLIWLAQTPAVKRIGSTGVPSHQAETASAVVSEGAPAENQKLAYAFGKKKVAAAESVVPATPEWQALNNRVKNLSSEDQHGLDDLYADSARLIHAHEKEVDAYFASSMSEVVGGTLEQSFFAVSSWMRYSSIPTAVLDHLWDYTPPADEPVANEAEAHHHAAFTQGFRYQALQAYALGELRKRFLHDGINLSSSERESLVKSLVAKVASEKSINQSLEIFETLLALGEKKAVLDALSTRSERDRKLIAETIGIQLES